MKSWFKWRNNTWSTSRSRALNTRLWKASTRNGSKINSTSCLRWPRRNAYSTHASLPFLKSTSKPPSMSPNPATHSSMSGEEGNTQTYWHTDRPNDRPTYTLLFYLSHSLSFLMYKSRNLKPVRLDSLLCCSLLVSSKMQRRRRRRTGCILLPQSDSLSTGV